MILDGKLVSSSIKESLKQMNISPKLVVIQVGHDSASDVYIKNKKKCALEIGAFCEHVCLEEEINEYSLIEIIKKYNEDSSVDGIIVQLPLPNHINSYNVLNEIDPDKDVDGLTEINSGKLVCGKPNLVSCTPFGIIKLLKYYDIPIVGKNVVIVGRSNLVGKPLVSLFLNEDATVTCCHSKTVNLKEHTLKADILVVAVGKPKLITADMVSENAVVIDVGINRLESGLCGDVDFENVSKKASYITPVPGGVGAMTVAMLYSNLYDSYIKRHK